MSRPPKLLYSTRAHIILNWYLRLPIPIYFHPSICHPRFVSPPHSLSPLSFISFYLSFFPSARAFSSSHLKFLYHTNPLLIANCELRIAPVDKKKNRKEEKPFDLVSMHLNYYSMDSMECPMGTGRQTKNKISMVWIEMNRVKTSERDETNVAIGKTKTRKIQKSTQEHIENNSRGNLIWLVSKFWTVLTTRLRGEEGQQGNGKEARIIYYFLQLLILPRAKITNSRDANAFRTLCRHFIIFFFSSWVLFARYTPASNARLF